MTAYALQRKLGSGKGVTVSALHPGFVSAWWSFADLRVFGGRLLICECLVVVC